ncbi:MAG: SDR family oxidoreductase [Acidobacteriota bacterium]
MSAFDGRVALITGASSGIGAALARELARQGASLALLARRTDRLESLAEEIRGMGRRAISVTCDVSRDDDINRAVGLVLADLGQIDVAVANAGFGVVGRIERLAVEDFKRQFEVNVFGVLRTLWATLPELKRRQGTFVMVGSVAGYLPGPRTSAYASSKAAVHSLSASLCAELASDGVAVVLISPGYVTSEIRQVDNLGRFHAEAPDPVPRWLAMHADVAAKKIARGIARKRREVVVTLHGKLAVFLARHAFWLLAALSRSRRRPRHEPGRADEA